MIMLSFHGLHLRILPEHNPNTLPCLSDTLQHNGDGSIHNFIRCIPHYPDSSLKVSMNYSKGTQISTTLGYEGEEDGFGYKNSRYRKSGSIGGIYERM
jgi:hypothetical protein